MPPLGYRYDPDERFIAKVTVDHQSGCFVWNACKGANGYGQFGLGGKCGPRATAHRWAYERYVETIPDGLVLDHLCRNPSCVNPDHLEPVTVASGAALPGLRGLATGRRLLSGMGNRGNLSVELSGGAA